MTDTPAAPYPGDAAHRVICQQVVELLGDYLEDALAAPLRIDVAAHLAACPECQLFLDQLQRTVQLIGTLPDSEQLPEPIVELLVQEFGRLTVD